MNLDDNYKELAMAIIKQAALDYKQGLLDNDKTEVAVDEKFFQGKWFKQLAPDLSGPALMARLKKATLEFRDNCDNIFSACDHDEDPAAARASLSTKTKGSWDPDSYMFKCPVCGGKVYINYCRLGFHTAISQTDENIINKTGEKWGYHAVCMGCNLFYNRWRDSRMYDTPVMHCHCKKQLNKMRVEKAAQAKKTKTKLKTTPTENTTADGIFSLVD